jgi:hypothetical protein
MKKHMLFFFALILWTGSSWGVNSQSSAVSDITCYSPTNVQVPAVTTTTTSAIASWTPSTVTPNPEWIIEYGHSGFAHGTGTVQYVNTPVFTMNALTPGTVYDFYVRTYCAPGDSSLWVMKTFSTHFFECPAGSVPEAEVCGGATNDGCNLAVPAFEPLPCGQTKCGTSYYDGTLRDTDWYLFTITQTSDVTWTGKAEFSFLLGFVASPCPATAFIANASGDAGTIVKVTTRLNAGTYYAFASPQFEEHVACDSLDHYYATLTCNPCLSPALSSLTATNITGTSANLGWTHGGNETAWEYVIGLSPLPVPAGAGIPTTNNPVPVSGLSESSNYCFYVRSSCGGTFGAWVGPYCFSTLCDPVTLTHCEPFGVAGSLPLCWTQTHSGGVTTNRWSITSTNNAFGTAPNEATCKWTNEIGTVRMISGAYNTTGLTSVHLAFRQHYDDYISGNDVAIMLQSSPDGLTWTTMWSHAGGTNSSIPPELKELDIPVSGSKVFFAWTVDGNLFSIDYWYVDDICVSAPSTSKTLTLNVFLEGLYAGGSAMNQAYDEFGPHFGPGIADQVNVELHNATNYSTIEYSVNNVDLSTGGNLMVSIPASFNSSYYITVRHRNSIETTSGAPVPFTGSNISYDFSTSAAQAYGDNMKSMGSVYTIWGGDVNQDGIVDTGDMNPVENESTNFTMGYVVEDVNGDGFIDTGDMNIVENNSTAIIQVITP